MRKGKPAGALAGTVDACLPYRVQRGYRWLLEGLVAQPVAALLIVGRSVRSTIGEPVPLGLPQEYTPPEDRGNVPHLRPSGPEGASYVRAVAGAWPADGRGRDDGAHRQRARRSACSLRVPGSWRSLVVTSTPRSARCSCRLCTTRTATARRSDAMAEVNAKLNAIQPGYRAFCIAQLGPAAAQRSAGAVRDHRRDLRGADLV